MTTRISRMIGVLVIGAGMVVGCTNAPATPHTVDVQTSDGVILKATVFTSGKPGPAVLLLHQCDEQRKVWDSLGVKLMRAGITALSVDFRGYGESGGTPHDKLSPEQSTRLFREQWPADVDSAYATMLRIPGVAATNVGVAGASCGVDNALQLAERRHDIKALALLAGPTDHAGREFMHAEGAPPIFLGAAADDKYDKFVEIQGWYGALSSNKNTRIIEYPDGGHAAMVFNKHPEFADSIVKWFSAVLLNKPELLPVTNGRAMDSNVLATLHELGEPGGVTTVAQKLADARKTDPTAQLFPEYYANQIGYDHMLAKDYTGAIAIMTLNTVAYPNSPNAQDSLGDVLLASGDTAGALKTARHTLDLLAKDTADTPERIQTIRTAAEGKIRQLGGK